jgi:DNA repair/transcription protein MET18/MMS19
MTRFSGQDAVKIATSLFAEAQDLLQHPQSTRFVVYTLLDALLAGQRAALKGMGDGFVIGFTDLASGEKDPRNLMVVFSMLKVLIVEWNIKDLANVLFDSVFCYFPITFRPPPDDPYGISAQDLKSRLRECLAASDYFSGLVFPALLDKVDSNSANVKVRLACTVLESFTNINQRKTSYRRYLHVGWLILRKLYQTTRSSYSKQSNLKSSRVKMRRLLKMRLRPSLR